MVTAIVWANVAPHGYHHLIHTSPFGPKSPLNLHFFANEILMVFFFGVAAKEITEACLPGGALNPPRKAVNPLMATLGGILGPVGVYFALVARHGFYVEGVCQRESREDRRSRWRSRLAQEGTQTSPAVRQVVRARGTVLTPRVDRLS